MGNWCRKGTAADVIVKEQSITSTPPPPSSLHEQQQRSRQQRQQAVKQEDQHGHYRQFMEMQTSWTASTTPRSRYSKDSPPPSGPSSPAERLRTRRPPSRGDRGKYQPPPLPRQQPEREVQLLGSVPDARERIQFILSPPPSPMFGPAASVLPPSVSQEERQRQHPDVTIIVSSAAAAAAAIDVDAVRATSSRSPPPLFHPMELSEQRPELRVMIDGQIEESEARQTVEAALAAAGSAAAAAMADDLGDDADNEFSQSINQSISNSCHNANWSRFHSSTATRWSQDDFLSLPGGPRGLQTPPRPTAAVGAPAVVKYDFQSHTAESVASLPDAASVVDG